MSDNGTGPFGAVTPYVYDPTKDPNLAKSVPPFAQPLTIEHYAATPWAAWFNQVAKQLALMITKIGPVLNLGAGGALGIGGAANPAYPLDIRGPASSQVHIASSDVDDGTYILSAVVLGSPVTYISTGCMWNGSAWVAKDANASILILGPIQVAIAYNSGLTVGNTFTPINVFTLDLTTGKAALPEASSGVAVGKATPGYALDAAGDCNITGTYRVNGTPLGTGQAQTPWAQNINGAGYQLQSSGSVGIGIASPRQALDVAGGGVVIAGTSAGAVPSSLIEDFAGGNSRFISCGPNTTTSGGFQFLTLHSDGSGAVVALTISTGNIAVFGYVPVFASDSAAGTGGVPSGGLWKDSSGNAHIKL